VRALLGARENRGPDFRTGVANPSPGTTRDVADSKHVSAPALRRHVFSVSIDELRNTPFFSGAMDPHLKGNSLPGARQLLAYGREEVPESRVLNLNGVVADLENMLPHLIGEAIELHTSLVPSLGQIRADQGQIERVIVNLVINARDAMPQGGKLVMETFNVELNEVYALHHPPLVPGYYVCLSVADTGVGMDAHTQEHIFEPFFTTKPEGQGTGLGLSTVYAVIKQSNGYVWVHSELGVGSVFKIYLPRVDEPACRPWAGGIAAALPQRSETILLVEDEPSSGP
jgi:two-component system, cell cycle sensor histidine kinase and response regulator CckA